MNNLPISDIVVGAFLLIITTALAAIGQLTLAFFVGIMTVLYLLEV